jgi:hypothetical protein
VGVQAHAPFHVPPPGAPGASNTTPPFLLTDFDFLAGAFLLGAGEGSYLQFGATGCWTTAGCWPLAPALRRPLGPPAGPAARADSAITLQPNVDAIDGAVPTPGANSTDGLIVFVGRVDSVDACAAACLAWPAPQALLECQSFTYVGAGGGDWARTCYARLDFTYIATAVPPALTVTSGRRSTRFVRVFAHALCDVDLITGNATITWDCPKFLNKNKTRPTNTEEKAWAEPIPTTRWSWVSAPCLLQWGKLRSCRLNSAAEPATATTNAASPACPLRSAQLHFHSASASPASASTRKAAPPPPPLLGLSKATCSGDSLR